MVDYLVNRGSAVPGLWTDRGVAGEDVKIRDCLDENRPFEDIEWGMAAGVRRSVDNEDVMRWFREDPGFDEHFAFSLPRVVLTSSDGGDDTASTASTAGFSR